MFGDVQVVARVEGRAADGASEDLLGSSYAVLASVWVRFDNSRIVSLGLALT